MARVSDGHQPSGAGSGGWALAPSLLAHMPDQRALLDRVKPAIKTALATVLAYYVALSMDWEKCSLGRLRRGVLWPVDRRRIADQGPAAVIRTLVGVWQPSLSCPVPAGSLAALIGMSILIGSAAT